jgi:UDP-2,4-diacetamido-2,4,6-trideoxy-beta-L-altropyranose hydrolase
LEKGGINVRGLKTELNIFFRVDSSIDIGSGHVMRCLALAIALREVGGNCQFLCMNVNGDLNDLIRQNGFLVHDLAMLQKFPSLGEGQSNDQRIAPLWRLDAENSLKYLINVDWLIIDHYSIDYKWERHVKSSVKKIMVIDDLANRTHDCDLILDQNMSRTNSDYMELVPKRSKILTGSAYVMLRQEFIRQKQFITVGDSSSRIKKMLISMGGADSANITGMILKSLNDCPLDEDLQITVVIGVASPWKSEIRNQALNMAWKTSVLVGVENMAQIIGEVDLAIGAAGSSAWERCFMGLPSITLVLAENQRVVAEALVKSGIAALVDPVQNIAQQLESILTNLQQEGGLKKMRAATEGLIDGFGMQRVVRELLNAEPN